MYVLDEKKIHTDRGRFRIFLWLLEIYPQTHKGHLMSPSIKLSDIRLKT